MCDEVKNEPTKPIIPGGGFWTQEMFEAMDRREPTEDDAEDREYYRRAGFKDSRETW